MAVSAVLEVYCEDVWALTNFILCCFSCFKCPNHILNDELSPKSNDADRPVSLFHVETFHSITISGCTILSLAILPLRRFYSVNFRVSLVHCD